MDDPADPAIPLASDDALCERICSGDPEAECALVERLQPAIRLILHRETGGNYDLAGELCQDTLIIVLQRVRTRALEDPRKLAAYAAQTARNLVISNRRRDRRRRTDIDSDSLDLAVDPGRDAPDQLHVSRLRVVVRELLEQLPSDRDRTVLRRFYIDEDDRTLICRDLQLSEQALNQVLHRARRRLRELLDDAGVSRHDLPDAESVR